MALRASSSRLCGRHGEMARLERALDVAREDGSAVVLIAGEAGVGKIASRARARHACRAGAGSVSASDGAWTLARRSGRWPHCGRWSPRWSRIWTARRSISSWAAPVVCSPSWCRSSVKNEPGTRRCRAIVCASSSSACSSGSLSEHPLVRRGRGPALGGRARRARCSRRWAECGRLRPLLLVGTFRSDELHRRHPAAPVLAEIERTGQCERIEVRPFDRTATAELIAAPRRGLRRRIAGLRRRVSIVAAAAIRSSSRSLSRPARREWRGCPTRCATSSSLAPPRSTTSRSRCSASSPPLGRRLPDVLADVCAARDR